MTRFLQFSMFNWKTRKISLVLLIIAQQALQPTICCIKSVDFFGQAFNIWFHKNLPIIDNCFPRMPRTVQNKPPLPDVLSVDDEAMIMDLAAGKISPFIGYVIMRSLFMKRVFLR